MDIEFCVQNSEEVALASQYGIKRVELCAALSVGGLTPSLGTIISCCKVAKHVEIHVLIRSKEGKFTATSGEVDILIKDIKTLKDFKEVKGIVFGILTDDYQLDISANKKIVDVAKSQKLEVTFHRAFDFVKKPFITLEKLIEIGFDSVLTSGQCDTAYEGLENIISYANLAKGRIQIMAGSGINQKNASHFINKNINTIHFTPTTQDSNEGKSMGTSRSININKIEGILMQIKQ